MRSKNQRKRSFSLLIRGGLLVAIATALIFILTPARNQVRLNHQSKQSLLVKV